MTDLPEVVGVNTGDRMPTVLVREVSAPVTIIVQGQTFKRGRIVTLEQGGTLRKVFHRDVTPKLLLSVYEERGWALEDAFIQRLAGEGVQFLHYHETLAGVMYVATLGRMARAISVNWNGRWQRILPLYDWTQWPVLYDVPGAGDE